MWIVLAGGAVAQEAAEDGDPDNAPTAVELHEMKRGEFRELPEVSKPIDFSDIDRDLLSAAVFHETNRRRADHDLPALGFNPALREAARMQSRGMRREHMISHMHPDEEKRTLRDRLDETGANGRFFAENVAMVFGIQYESGEPFYSRIEDGETILSKKPDGPPIPPHTYLSFAENLLDSWMDSPGHRKNILATEPEQLGASCLHERMEDGMDRFFCTQVFFAPFDRPQPTLPN